MKYILIAAFSYTSLLFSCGDKINNDVLPHEVISILDEHTQELKDFLRECNLHPNARMGTNTTQKSWLPGWFIKCGIERVENSKKLANFIRERGFDKVSVADKYLYHVADTPEDISNENYLVLVKNVSGKCGKGQRLNLEQVKQLYDLAIEMKHYDLHPANYVTTQEGTVVIIDTDKLAMPSLEECTRLEQDWILNGTRIHDNGGTWMNPDIINDPSVKLELAMYSKWQNYDEQAYEYLDQKIRAREKYRLGLLLSQIAVGQNNI